MVTKDLGMVTAYAYAVAGGYTGTEAEFTQLMADLAIVVDDFDNFSVTVTTLPAGSSATASYADGVLSLGIPKGDKGDKGNTGDTGATPQLSIGTVTTTTEPSVTITGTAENPVLNFGLVKGDKGDTGEVSEAELAETLESYAKTDGYYSNLTAGSAEQLLSTVTIEDEVPYQFRTSGGSVDIGDRETDMLVGGTVAWNQLFPMNDSQYNTQTINGVTFTKNNDGTWTINGTATENTVKQIDYNSPTMIKGHKYLYGSATWKSASYGITANNYYSNKDWALGITNVPINLVAYVREGVTVNNVVLKPQLFDLTAMFGSTIADYIYSLEQATAGAGVAWFRKLFPKPYYEYNAGELMSVKTSAHQMVGFNQLDPAKTKIGGAYNPTVGNIINLDSTGATYTGTNPIEINVTASWCGCCLISEPLVAGQRYEVAFKTSAPTTADKRVSQYLIDADNRVITNPYNWVGNAGDNITRTFTPTESGLRCAVTILSTSAQKITVTDPCVHLVWDGERNGEYEPYVKHSYPLDDSLTLRGVPKLDSSNNLYYDGDEYESDGMVTRKYGVVDLGTLTYTRTTSGLFKTTVSGIKSGNANIVENIIAQGYTTIPSQYAYGPDGTNPSPNMICALTAQETVYFNNTSYTDPTAFKTAMSGVYLVYELATPTTESAEPYQNPQIVDDFGTEEYVTDSIVPVGHKTQYMPNLRAKLEMAPNSPNGNGDYIVRQTNGMNEYVPLVIEDTLPTIPSTAGSYRLTVTVTEGSDPVLSWEAE